MDDPAEPMDSSGHASRPPGVDNPGDGPARVPGGAAPDQRLTPGERLHHGGDYSRVFNRQQKAAGRWCVLLLRPRSAREGRTARLGVMVPGKAVRTAVRRHRIKRWVRELFRTRLKSTLAGHDAVVLLRADPVVQGSHAQLDAELISLVARALATQAHPQRRGRGGR
jgi:ribonuclease P protein component